MSRFSVHDRKLSQKMCFILPAYNTVIRGYVQGVLRRIQQLGSFVEHLKLSFSRLTLLNLIKKDLCTFSYTGPCAQCSLKNISVKRSKEHHKNAICMNFRFSNLKSKELILTLCLLYWPMYRALYERSSW